MALPLRPLAVAVACCVIVPARPAFHEACSFDAPQVEEVALLQISHPTRSTSVRSRRSAEVAAFMEERRYRQPPGPGGKGIFIGVMSAPQNTERRSEFRKQCVPAIKNASLPYMFFVGRPSAPDGKSHKDLGSLSTAKEIEIAAALRAEQEAHGDLHVIASVDEYWDLTDKVIQLFDYGLDAGYDLTIKLDDDWCPDGTLLKSWAQEGTLDMQTPLYLGLKRMTGYESQNELRDTNQDGRDIQLGPSGERVAYYEGACYGLSRPLAGMIFRERSLDTVLFESYGHVVRDMGRVLGQAEGLQVMSTGT